MKKTKLLALFVFLTTNLFASIYNPNVAEFKTAEDLIKSYLNTISKIKKPSEVYENQENYENILKHYTNEEIEFLFFNLNSVEEVNIHKYKYSHNTEESAIIVTRNFIYHLNENKIDLEKILITEVSIAFDTVSKTHPDINFAKADLLFNYKGKTHKLRIALVQYKKYWFLFDGPIGFNDKILSSSHSQEKQNLNNKQKKQQLKEMENELREFIEETEEKKKDNSLNLSCFRFLLSYEKYMFKNYIHNLYFFD